MMMNIKKILISGVIIWLVGAVFGWLTCGWLFNWVYQIPPNIWRPPEVMFQTGNLILSNLFGLITAIIFVAVYEFIMNGLPGDGVKRGVIYGFIVWLVGALAGMVTMPFYMTIATTVVIYWIINALVINLIKGAIVGAIYRVK